MMTFSELLKQRGLKAAIDKLIFGRILNLHWTTIQPILLRPTIYNFFKKYKWLEAEHQIGRLINMDKIFKHISDNNIEGDIVEFGSYQGFSLKWIIYFRKKYNLTNKKIIIIDAFEGLPQNSGHWYKGQFSDTSKNILINNIYKYSKINSLEKENIYIIEGYFNTDKVNSLFINFIQDIALCHIDCDLGSSCDEAFKMLDLLNLNHNYYLLFDDWGCGIDEIPKSFNKYKKQHKILKFKEHSKTKLTKYFEVVL